MALGIILIAAGAVGIIIGLDMSMPAGVVALITSVVAILSGSGLILLARRVAALNGRVQSVERDAELQEKFEDRQLRKAALTKIDKG